MEMGVEIQQETLDSKYTPKLYKWNLKKKHDSYVWRDSKDGNPSMFQDVSGSSRWRPGGRFRDDGVGRWQLPPKLRWKDS